MEARLVRAAFLAALLSCALASPALANRFSARSQHFIVTASTPQLAQEIAQAAETYRRDLAIEWLGHELPPWRDVCPIAVTLAPGAGGATSFMFDAAGPHSWTMQIQGSRERMLDSVLPHEITHTIFATHFGRPLPRWADEGACTTVEHPGEKAKQDKFLIQFLTSERGIPFNQMFAMTEYPRDILPLYSQGYSLARYLIQQGGKRKYVDYVGEGMRTNNWPATTRKFYGFENLSDLQVTWVEWVRQGSPNLDERPELASRTRPPSRPVTQLASLTQQPQTRVPDGVLQSWQTTQSQNARVFARAEDDVPPEPPVADDPSDAQPQADYSRVSRPVSDGWYARRRDAAQQVLRSSPAETGISASQSKPASPPRNALPASPAGTPAAQPASGKAIGAQPAAEFAPAAHRQVLLEWSRSGLVPADPTAALTGVALNDAGATWR
jgi:hypothetical protein